MSKASGSQKTLSDKLSLQNATMENQLFKHTWDASTKLLSGRRLVEPKDPDNAALQQLHSSLTLQPYDGSHLVPNQSVRAHIHSSTTDFPGQHGFEPSATNGTGISNDVEGIEGYDWKADEQALQAAPLSYISVDSGIMDRTGYNGNPKVQKRNESLNDVRGNAEYETRPLQSYPSTIDPTMLSHNSYDVVSQW